MELKIYFNDPEIVKQDLNNDYKQITCNDIQYLVKGKSAGKGFVLYNNLNIYLLDSQGDIEDWFSIKALKPAKFGNIVNITECGQIDKDTYYAILSDDEQGTLVIFDYINKNICNEKYYYLSNPEFPVHNHGFDIINANHVFIFSNNQGLIQEIDNGNLIWEFDVSELSNEIEQYSLRPGIHVNCIKEFDKDNILISFRNSGICKLNKNTKQIEWFIGYKRNDFNFKDLPMLQHSIWFLNKEHTKFVTFNNNWDHKSEQILNILTNKQLSDEVYKSLCNSGIIIYDLKKGISEQWTSNMLASLRLGNVEYNDNYFFINYGSSLIKNADNLYTLNLLEEYNTQTKNINFSFKTDKYYFGIHSRI